MLVLVEVKMKMLVAGKLKLISDTMHNLIRFIFSYLCLYFHSIYFVKKQLPS